MKIMQKRYLLKPNYFSAKIKKNIKFTLIRMMNFEIKIISVQIN